jgi:hypothetical protein
VAQDCVLTSNVDCFCHYFDPLPARPSLYCSCLPRYPSRRARASLTEGMRDYSQLGNMIHLPSSRSCASSWVRVLLTVTPSSRHAWVPDTNTRNGFSDVPDGRSFQSFRHPAKHAGLAPMLGTGSHMSPMAGASSRSAIPRSMLAWHQCLDRDGGCAWCLEWRGVEMNHSLLSSIIRFWIS